MILGQTLQRHLGVDWCVLRRSVFCIPDIGFRRYQRKHHRELLRWFMDAPKVFSYYSIHRMLEFGRRYGKEAGEWYGPNTVALVLQDLVRAHRHVKASASETQQQLEMIVTENGTIYVDQVSIGRTLRRERSLNFAQRYARHVNSPAKPRHLRKPYTRSRIPIRFYGQVILTL